MNKFLPISILSLLSMNVFAVPFDGFYAGASLGGTRATFDNNITTDASLVFGGTLQQNISHANNPSVGDSSWTGGLDLGFGHVFNQYFYLGIEGTGQIESISNNNTFAITPSQVTGITYNRNIKSQLQDEIALTVDPGIVIHKTTLLYGKIGPSWGCFSTNDNFTFGAAIAPGQQLSSVVSANNNGYQSGLRLGLGIEHYMTDYFSLRLEYINNNYGTINSGDLHSSPILLNGTADPTIAGSTATSSDKITARSNTVMLGINYHLA